MGNILYRVIIYPLILIVELIYSVLVRFVVNPGLAIIGVSIAVSFLVLPLYKRSDEIQEEERKRQADMDYWVRHIKKTFRGDERVMLLSAYYRQKGYKQIYALRSSLSLLLQVPFFIAAYSYLSGLQALKGASFLMLEDLSKPDGLIRIGSVAINVLPILMTAVNCLSGMIYSKGFSLKEKLKLHGLAVVFLVLLYNRPSGLVLYWTMNNVFSLFKNIILRVRRPDGTVKKNDIKKQTALAEEKPTGLYIFGGAVLTVFLGLLIPSSVIGDSVAEFYNPNEFVSPLHYVFNNVYVFAGLFILWAFVLYYLAKPEKKPGYARFFWILSCISIIDYFFFGKKYGFFSPMFVFDQYPSSTVKSIVLNLCVLLAATVVAVLIWKYQRKWIQRIYSIFLAAFLVLTVVNIQKIQSQISKVEITKAIESVDDIEPLFSLSKQGKNVIVLMLDRAIGPLFPYILQDQPQLAAEFEGFTYYARTLSFGTCTNYGAPALYGGYEYTPQAMNARTEEKLVDKNNEALKLMPALFYGQGYQVTVCDPSYANYQWVPDLSIYDDYPDMNTYNTEGKYNRIIDGEFRGVGEKKQQRAFAFYSLFKAAPLFLQTTIYDEGNYFSTETLTSGNETFMDAYSVLCNLSYLTDVKDDASNNFLMMANHTTHAPAILQLPSYEPARNVDNIGLWKPESFDIDGRKINFEGYPDMVEQSIAHYHANTAALLKVGNWLDYLRKKGVFDNTRIIIVADHGFPHHHFDDLVTDIVDIEGFCPLLLVKDFGSTGEIAVSEELMTNADTPLLATEDIIDDPVNPFTGISLKAKAEKNGYLFPVYSPNWQVEKNNGNVFDSEGGSWYQVHDDIYKAENWSQVEEDYVNSQYDAA